ncbi:MAG TPA: aminotransferase class IV [Polyangiaceae bacterium]|jgi:branched-chain amino acid aminotransferase
MQTTVMIDGELVPPERALVSVFDRGFLYGDSVFEALRTHHGKLHFLDAHLARVARSVERVLIALPISLSGLRDEILAAVRAHGSREVYLRLIVTRGSATSFGLDTSLSEGPRRIVLVSDLKLPPAELHERGISAITLRIERAGDEAGVSSAKLGNYLSAVLALQKARVAGASEALVEDAHGSILEGSTSNLFAVIAGVLVTAPVSAAILPGITRGRVLELARASELGIAVEERVFSKAELSRADEVFITSSIREVVPVVNIDGRTVASGAPGPIARELLARFRASVAG